MQEDILDEIIELLEDKGVFDLVDDFINSFEQDEENPIEVLEDYDDDSVKKLIKGKIAYELSMNRDINYAESIIECNLDDDGYLYNELAELNGLYVSGNKDILSILLETLKDKHRYDYLLSLRDNEMFEEVEKHKDQIEELFHVVSPDAHLYCIDESTQLMLIKCLMCQYLLLNGKDNYVLDALFIGALNEVLYDVSELNEPFTERVNDAYTDIEYLSDIQRVSKRID